MLSYHADMDIETNPFELGLDRLVDLDMDADYVSKAALRKIVMPASSAFRLALPLMGRRFPDQTIFSGRSALTERLLVRSPRQSTRRALKNIALAMIAIDHRDIGTSVEVDKQELGETRRAEIRVNSVLRSEEIDYQRVGSADGSD